MVLLTLVELKISENDVLESKLLIVEFTSQKTANLIKAKLKYRDKCCSSSLESTYHYCQSYLKTLCHPT